MSALLRAEWLLAQYGVPIAVALALAGVLALGGAWSVYDNPPTEIVTETTDELRIEAGYNTSAVVADGSPLYESGTTLRDRSAYFYNGTSNVTVALRTSLSPDRTTDLDARLVLLHSAARDGEVFWERRRLLAVSNETVAGDGTVLTATLNMSAVREFVERKRRVVAGVGTLRTNLVATVDYETDSFDGRLAGSSRVVTTGRAYWFDGSTLGNRTHAKTETREVTGEPDLAGVLALLVVSLGFFASAGGVVLLQRRTFDLGRIEAELTRTRYDEWISQGEIPTKLQKAYVKTDSLVDLVDIAIDSNKRVIYDDEYDAYAVVEADVVYYYAEGDTGLDQWLDL